MSTIAKPELRGFLKRRIIKTFIGAIAFGTVNSALFYVFYVQRRRNAVEEYFRNYDPDEHFKILKKYGYLDSELKKKKKM